MSLRAKYVKPRSNKNGTTRWYWDRPGFKQVRLPDEEQARLAEALRLNAEAETDNSPHKRSEGLPKQLQDHLFTYWIASYRGARGGGKLVQSTHPGSPQWHELADATKQNYNRELDPIDEKFGDLPVVSITRRVIMTYLETLAKSRRSTALSTFKNVLTRAYFFGAVARIETLELRTQRPKARTDVIWQEEDIDAFLETAPRVSTRAYPQLVTGFLLALHTGQRMKDVLSMKWSDFDGEYLYVVQQKTGRKVSVYAHTEIQNVLEAAKDRNKRTAAASIFIVPMMHGGQYNRHAYWRLFERTRNEAGLKHLRFHDLRRTAATRLALAGNDIPNICSVTGHSAQSIKTLVDVYLGERKRLSKDAMLKQEAKRAEQRASILQNAS